MRTRSVSIRCLSVQAYLAIFGGVLLGATNVAAQAAPAPAAAHAPSVPAADTTPAPATSAQEAPAQPPPPVQPGAEIQRGSVSAETSTAKPSASEAAAQPPAPTAATSEPAASPEASAESETSDEVAQELSSEETKINVYGFADFTFSSLLSDKKTSGTSTGVGPNPTFYVGNLNVYLDSNLGNKFRSLIELRFTYLPDGALMTDNATFQTTRLSAAYPDYTDYSRTKKVGGVMIERAWLEYAAHPLFNIRVGQWLTPYGIWNVDHGSPVILGVTRPYIVGAEWLPQRQTGIETYGTYGFENTQVGYHLTLSNGRGPVDSYMDLDKNKAIGWRLWARQDTSFGTIALGTSGYRGKYTDAGQVAAMENGSYVTNFPVTSSYDELGLAADLKYTWGGFLFQSEYIMREMRYDDAVRPAGMTPGSWTQDNRTWGMYFQTGYRLPWYGIMPWFGYEYDRLGKSGYLYEACDIVGGLNIRPKDNVVFKLVGLHVWMPYLKEKSMDFDQLMAQVAWSF